MKAAEPSLSPAHLLLGGRAVNAPGQLGGCPKEGPLLADVVGPHHKQRGCRGGVTDASHMSAKWARSQPAPLDPWTHTLTLTLTWLRCCLSRHSGRQQGHCISLWCE